MAGGGEGGEGVRGERAVRRAAVEELEGLGRVENARPPSEALRATTTTEAGIGNSLGLIWTSQAGRWRHYANFCRLVKRRVAYDFIIVMYMQLVGGCIDLSP